MRVGFYGFYGITCYTLYARLWMWTPPLTDWNSVSVMVPSPSCSLVAFFLDCAQSSETGGVVRMFTIDRIVSCARFYTIEHVRAHPQRNHSNNSHVPPSIASAISDRVMCPSPFASTTASRPSTAARKSARLSLCWSFRVARKGWCCWAGLWGMRRYTFKVLI